MRRAIPMISRDAANAVAGAAPAGRAPLTSAARAIRYWLPLIAWMAVIFALSHIPVDTVESVLHGPLDIAPEIAKSDLVIHPLEFGVLAILAYRLLASYRRMSRRYALLGAFGFALAYGALDEFHQSFVPGRSATLADLGLDALGALLGLAAIMLIARLAANRAAVSEPDI